MAEGQNPNQNEYDNYAAQTGGRLFSSAMFGFNKEEVLEYLEELADENFQQQEAAEMRIQELTGRIQTLEAGLTQAQQNEAEAPDTSELEAAQEKLQQQVAELSGQLQKLQDQLDTAKAEAAKAKEQLQQYTDLESQLDIANAATQQAEEELQQYKEDLATARQQNEWLREEYQNSDSQIADLQRQLEAAASAPAGESTQEEEKLRGELAAALAENQSLSDQLQLVQASVAAAPTQEALDELETQVRELEFQLEQAQNTPAEPAPDDSEELLAEIDALQKQLEQAQASADDELRQENEALRRQLEMARMQDQSDALRTQVAQMRAQIAGLETQLKEAHDSADAELAAENEELRGQLEAALGRETDEDLRAMLEKAQAEIEDLKQQLEEATDYGEWTEEDEKRDAAYRSATAIIEEATAEAQRIREDAANERGRMQRQLKGTTSGLTESITNLRDEVSEVEGDVSGILEAVQAALADVLNALGRTEQDLSTFDTQIDRFPASAPVVPKQVVYFEPSSEQLYTVSGGAGANPAPSYGSGGFRRLVPAKDGNLKQFRPSYTNSSTAAEAVSIDEAQEEKLRSLSETLVETLKQMLN